ncbi:MAG: hypothetical protein M3P84_07440 [Chloroflexota bacterium]|nr:hypothetical protein [Chloroflexota bacterium]
MTRREAWLTAGILFVIALVVRALVAATVPFPTPEDTAYYVSVARNIVDGQGLVSNAIWSYGTPPLRFPRDAFEVWLPLPAFLAAIPMYLLGTSFHAAQVSTVLIGALVPVLAWRLAADVAEEREMPVGRARTLAIGTGLTAVVSLPVLLHGVLPDSTSLFTVLALAGCLLMTRLVREPRRARPGDRRLVALGIVFGLAALTRNEFLWLGLIWVFLAWRAPFTGREERIRLIVAPALIGFAILAPWLVRDWQVFGNPLPGQAATNALSVTGFDIFAWQDPPTLSRYLAQGPAWLLTTRVEGFLHNLLDVLLVPGAPVSLLGLIALPWVARGAALRPLVLLSAVTFVATTLLFPVSTTWGTFLHAAGPVHVLLIIGGLLALDRIIVRAGEWRGWTKPVAWLGPTLTISGALLFSVGILAYAGQARDTERRYAALIPAMTAAGITVDPAVPVITNFPIWYAAGTGGRALALPDESPASILDLAGRFGAKLLVMTGTEHGRWPAVIDAGGPAVACFHEVDLPTPAAPADAATLRDTRVFRVGCP